MAVSAYDRHSQLACSRCAAESPVRETTCLAANLPQATSRAVWSEGLRQPASKTIASQCCIKSKSDFLHTTIAIKALLEKQCSVVATEFDYMSKPFD